ncbi:MAG TPA: DUF6588 family protein [Candidatus Krumholzibacteria bacterium]|nr:DUF6588 family protein [Candidatus Krumholzibacteria bacterium]
MLATPALGQVDNRLEAYTGRNATGYLAPLVDAFRSNLNSGLFHTADVPVNGFHARLDLNVMSTFFGEDSRTFLATTEAGFSPEQTVRAPTVVGPTDAVVVDGDASTKFAFPGGFNVDNMYFSAPQLTVGGWKGTEAMGRLIIYDTGSSELGRLNVWGVGLRHSLSQYAHGLDPVDLALAGYWQNAELKNTDDQRVIDARLATLSLQSGVPLGSFYPYAGLSVGWWEMDVHYGFDEVVSADPQVVEFRTNGDFQMTLGVSYQVGFIAAYGEYNFAAQNTVAAGLSVNFPFSNRSVTQ